MACCGIKHGVLLKPAGRRTALESGSTANRATRIGTRLLGPDRRGRRAPVESSPSDTSILRFADTVIGVYCTGLRAQVALYRPALCTPACKPFSALSARAAPFTPLGMGAKPPVGTSPAQRSSSRAASSLRARARRRSTLEFLAVPHSSRGVRRRNAWRIRVDLPPNLLEQAPLNG